MADLKVPATRKSQSSPAPPAGPSEVEPHGDSIPLNKRALSGALESNASSGLAYMQVRELAGALHTASCMQRYPSPQYTSPDVPSGSNQLGT